MNTGTWHGDDRRWYSNRRRSTVSYEVGAATTKGWPPRFDVPCVPVPAVEAVEWLLMECAYFRDDLCSSCPQLWDRLHRAGAGEAGSMPRALLAAHSQLRWLDPVTSAGSGLPQQGEARGGRFGEEPDPRHRGLPYGRLHGSWRMSALYGADSGGYSGAA